MQRGAHCTCTCMTNAPFVIVNCLTTMCDVKLILATVFSFLPLVHMVDITYSRRQKNGDVSVPFRSVQTETDTVSVQLKTENGVQ